MTHETVATLKADGKITVDGENQWDVVQSLASDGESNGRDFSPFEFTASEFNKARNSEARWEAFDAGISDGIIGKHRRTAKEVCSIVCVIQE